MIIPPRVNPAPRRRPIGLYPDNPDWHTFALGAAALLAVAAILLFAVAHLGS